MRIHRLILPLAIAAGLVLTTAACSSDAEEAPTADDTASAAPTESGAETESAPAAPPTVPEADATVLQVAEVTLADDSTASVLVDYEGKTVYLLTEDSTEEPHCNDTDCFGFWSPVLTGTTDLVLGDGVTAEIGVWNHDGLDHLTIDDRPLYVFTGDQEPGDAGGHGLASNFGGGEWAAISPDGTVLSTDGIDTP